MGAAVMNKFALWLVSGLFGLATATQAADLPKSVFKTPPAPQAGDWTGYYAGLQAGDGWGSAHQTDGSTFDSGWYNLSGALAGVTWGYNWQVGKVVIGFENDAAWANIHGSTDGNNGFNGPCGGNLSLCESTLQAFGSNRLRLGYSIGRWLPYIAGGLAWGYVHGKEGDTPAGGVFGSGAEFHYGWTVGGGVEAMIDPHWSAKVEYLYADLRDGKAFVDQFSGGMADESVGMQVHILRAGLNYKFDPGHSLLPFLPPTPGASAGPWSWSGFYAGANYGGGAGRASQSDALFDRGQYDVGGSLAGATSGYNWQRGNLVYGLEADADYSRIEGATSGTNIPPCGAFSILGDCSTQLRWLGTARGRVGITWDRLMAYATGGAAVGLLKSSEGQAPGFLIGSGSVTRVGWTAGAGLEARIDQRWSAKLEYLYVDLGSGDIFTEPFIFGTVSENVSFRTSIVRGGLNYRFD
jgi:outer membrane immunogenic protein